MVSVLRTRVRRGMVTGRRRRVAPARYGVVIGAIAVLMLAACGGATAPSAPAGPSPVTQAASESTAPTQEQQRESGPSGTITIEIAEGSAARYRVNEQLARRNLPSDAVGNSGVAGSFVFDSEGNVISARSTVIVDLKGLSSGQDRRDNFLRERVLESNAFPTATFVLRETDGLPWPLPRNGEHAFRMIGDLTIRDVTREVVWDTVLRFDGDSVSGEAMTEFTFEYFGMDKPSLAFLLSVADEIQLELDLVANITSGL